MADNLANGVRSIFHKQRVEDELNEELENYLDASMADKVGRGMDAETARRAALVEMGSRNAVKHQVWSGRWESTLDGLLQDVRIGVRMLAKSPGFTLVALLSLALGIGGNTAIFTLIHQVMLRDLPVRDPQQLVTFDRSLGGGILGGVDLGYHGMFPWYFARQLEANPGPFQGIASYGSFSEKTSVRLPSLRGGQGDSAAALLVPTSLVSGNYFNVLGAHPLMGRVITSADDAGPGIGAVVVLSYHFWRDSLSADPAILGKTITINSTAFSVVGVMPENFEGVKMEMDPAELWTPMSMQTVVLQHPSFLTPDGPYFLHMFGRLSTQPGALERSQQWLNAQVRNGIRANEGKTISAARLQEINRVTVPLLSAEHGVSQMRGQYGGSLLILMIVVGLVLVMACANLANFLLARAATRQRETATRLALGSSRLRIVRQSLIETLLLSISGGVLGLGLAFVATRALIAFVSQGSSYTPLTSRPDGAVLLFTLGISLLTGLFFGLAPAIASARTAAAGTLSSSARTMRASGGRSSRLWPKALVTAQITLSMLLLVAAGLFLRTFQNLQNQDFGFERTHLLIANLNERMAGYKPSGTAALHEQLIERLAAIPGVSSAAVAAGPPIWPGNWSSSITIAGYTPAPNENMGSVLERVSGRYFGTVGVPILAGRAIADGDTQTSFKVAVVSQALANHFFPKGDALGRMVTLGIDDVKGPWQIIGIAKNTKSNDPREKDPARMIYIPIAQIEPFMPAANAAAGSGSAAVKIAPEENEDRYANTLILRTSGDPANAIADLRAAVAAIDPKLPLTNVITIHDQVSSMMTHDELISTLTGLFAVLALLLAAIGLYGVMSYNVVRRTNEIGIRFALGASGATVLWMVMRESLFLLLVGAGIGLPLSIATMRLAKEQLFGLSAMDSATFTVSIFVVTAMTLVAAWVPARRATMVDPMVALRCD